MAVAPPLVHMIEGLFFAQHQICAKAFGSFALLSVQ